MWMVSGTSTPYFRYRKRWSNCVSCRKTFQGHCLDTMTIYTVASISRLIDWVHCGSDGSWSKVRPDTTAVNGSRSTTAGISLPRLICNPWTWPQMNRGQYPCKREYIPKCTSYDLKTRPMSTISAYSASSLKSTFPTTWFETSFRLVTSLCS